MNIPWEASRHARPPLSVRALRVAARGTPFARDEFSAVRTVFEVNPYESMLAAARAGSDDDVAFKRAWREERSLTVDEALRLALEPLQQP